MKRASLLALLAATLLSACGTPSGPDGVAYQVDRKVYTPQDNIVASLVNTSEVDVGYNLCTADLERLTRGSWKRVARTPERMCIEPLYILHPGESATYREPASVVPGPGTYRLRTHVEAPISGGRQSVVTQPFTVRQ